MLTTTDTSGKHLTLLDEQRLESILGLDTMFQDFTHEENHLQ